MAKKNKVIYLEAPHKYSFGSFLKGIESGKGLGKFGKDYSGLSSGMQGALSGAASAVGQMAGSAISGGLGSGVGNTISGLGSVASAIPGPWGAVAGAGLGVVGGLINAAFGIKEDKEKHQRLDQATNYLRGFNSNATTFDEVTGPQAVSLDSNVYKGGWFSGGKARRKNQKLAVQAQEALDKANRDVVNNITTLTKNQMNDLEGSYFAFGGPLDFGLFPIGGAIDYELAQRRLAQKDLELKKAKGGPLRKRKSYEDWYKTVPTDRNDTTSYNLRRAYELAPMRELEAWRTSSLRDLKAGRNHLRSVYMDPKTGIYEFVKSKNHPTINMELDWYNGNTPDAIDFRKQYDLDTSGDYYRYVPKKALGGPLHTHGADWTNGITIIDNGGTHEQNPFEGVPMGVAPDGQPNLVEEGEVIFNDYVFSNRLKVPKAVREKYKLRGQKRMTFADAAKKAQKESEERPNDPISQRGLRDTMYKLMEEQEALRKGEQGRKYREGGGLANASKPKPKPTFDPDLTDVFLPGQRSYMPSYTSSNIFSPLPQPFSPLRRIPFTSPPSPPSINFFEGLSGPGDYEAFIKDYTKKRLSRPGEPGEQSPQYSPVHIDDIKRPYIPDKKSNLTLENWLPRLRFAPAIGASIGAFTDLVGLTNKPDYSNANMIVDAANQFGSVGFSPIGNYMTYTPLDRLFYANQLGAQAGATRRNILNISGGNRGTAMAGLLAADYNAQSQLGNLYRQAEEYNLGQRERVATFNRGTNMFNSEQSLKAAIANRERDKARIDALAKAAAIRDAVDSRVGAARSANLTNLFNSLGDIGREAFTMNMVMSNPALYYSINKQDGTITYKNGFDQLSEGEKAIVRREAERASKKGAYGGYLTIRKKR